MLINASPTLVHAQEHSELEQQGIQHSRAKASIEYLYPLHLRQNIFFDGKLSTERLPYLESIPHAEALSTLDVLRGNADGDLMLDSTAFRVEGATMLIRLLGAEKEALSGNWDHPFTDVPDWAGPYIGFLYENGLTKGVGNNKYGSDHMNEQSYLTFLLRALGYSDKEGGDFTWDTVGNTALEVGLIKPGEETKISDLLKRDRLSELSWRAMFLNHKAKNKPLLIHLYDQAMIEYESIDLLFSKNKNRTIDQWFAYLPKIEQAFIDHDKEIELPLSRDLATDEDLHKYIYHMLERAQSSTGVFLDKHSFLTRLRQQGNNYTLFINPAYVNTVSRDEKLSQWIDSIISEIIIPDMTDYEKEKAVHDYLIAYLEYDTKPTSMIPNSSFNALGALETRIAVCNAYAELMNIILNTIGIPCRTVIGYASDIEHAWNMVLIDGEPYHIDVTWDDPVTNYNGNTIRYDYFNLTDKEINKDHSWVEDNYLACVATSQNYFVKTGLVIERRGDLELAIKSAFENRKSGLMLRLSNAEMRSLNIHDVINFVNADVGYVITSYSYSFNETMSIIFLDSIEYAE